MKRHPSEPPAVEPPDGKAVSSVEDAPAVASKLDLPTGEYTGVRRSVFDLLKEKHPDLADPKSAPAKSAPAKSAPPAPAPPAVRQPAPPVKAVPSAETRPAPLRSQAPAPQPGREEPPPAEAPRKEPPARERPRIEPPADEPLREKPRVEPPPEDPASEKPRIEPPPGEPAPPRMKAAAAKAQDRAWPSPAGVTAGQLLKNKLRGWLAAVSPSRPAQTSVLPPSPESRRPEPAASRAATPAQPQKRDLAPVPAAVVAGPPAAAPAAPVRAPQASPPKAAELPSPPAPRAVIPEEKAISAPPISPSPSPAAPRRETFPVEPQKREVAVAPAVEPLAPVPRTEAMPAEPPKREVAVVPTWVAPISPVEPAASAPRKEMLAVEPQKREIAGAPAMRAVAALPALAKTEPSAPTPPVLPKAARPRRFAGPRKKVAVFWGGVAALFALGTYVLASLRPDPAPVAATALFPDSAAAALSARELSLEPEKVVVTIPDGTAKPAAKPTTKPTAKPPAKPPAKAATKPAPTKTADTKAADAKRERDAKKNAPKADSRMVIEPVAPVVPPVRTGGRQPEYPLEARSAGLEGTVVLNGLIGSDGKVKNARVVRGLSPPLDAAALAAFKTWRFKPATQKGKRVEFKYNAGIEFRINAPAEQVSAPQVAEAAPPPSAPAVPLVPAVKTGGPLAYGGDFTPPVRVTMVWPQKPANAQMVTGEVKLQLAVAADGSVGGVEVIEGLPQGVTEAAIEAVRQWKFKPARQLGEPVAVYHRVNLRF